MGSRDFDWVEFGEGKLYVVEGRTHSLIEKGYTNFDQMIFSVDLIEVLLKE